MFSLKKIVSLSALAGLSILSACSAGDGAGSSISGYTDSEVLAPRGTTIQITRSSHTVDDPIASMSWSSIASNAMNPSINLSNSDCSEKVQQEAVKTIDSKPIKMSDWTCTVRADIPGNAPPGLSYEIRLTMATTAGAVKTTIIPLNIQ